MSHKYQYNISTRIVVCMCVSCKGNKCHARAASGRRSATETNHNILCFIEPGQTQHLVLANKNIRVGYHARAASGEPRACEKKPALWTRAGSKGFSVLVHVIFHRLFSDSFFLVLEGIDLVPEPLTFAFKVICCTLQGV